MLHAVCVAGSGFSGIGSHANTLRENIWIGIPAPPPTGAGPPCTPLRTPLYEFPRVNYAQPPCFHESWRRNLQESRATAADESPRCRQRTREPKPLKSHWRGGPSAGATLAMRSLGERDVVRFTRLSINPRVSGFRCVRRSLLACGGSFKGKETRILWTMWGEKDRLYGVF